MLAVGACECLGSICGLALLLAVRCCSLLRTTWLLGGCGQVWSARSKSVVSGNFFWMMEGWRSRAGGCLEDAGEEGKNLDEGRHIMMCHPAVLFEQR